jgi:transcription factor C subunit 7
VEDVHTRCGGALNLIIPALERLFPGTERGRILLVGHAATVIALTRELAGDRDLPIKVGCTTLTELKRKPGSNDVLGAWDVVKLTDASHLAKGAEREWSFDYVVLDEHGQASIPFLVFVCA